MDKSINIEIEEGLMERVEETLDNMGLDISTAVNLFFRQMVYKKKIPFDIEAGEKKIEKKVKIPQPGCMRGQIWMAEDFNAPMEEFSEYM